ncbi:MAG TPA: adenylate/guanylate cyclase domain-containing protein [Gaiellaceae bacterium]|nr:adenylate/guanylate cyclase domain-containing protein [Gaiellaceae bacterium]
MREQRKVVTILFCDLVGSTALGESTDPEVVRARLRRTFEDLRAIIERHGGSVEKFVGDAVMAVFGVPVSHEDDALRAVRAAKEMQHAIAEHGLEARIGINTGEVVVGGEGETLVTGDAVNVAARLEQSAGSGEILIGAQTRALVRDAVTAEALEPIALKGKAHPVEAHRLLEVLEDAAPIERNLAAPLVGRERERLRLWRAYEDSIADRSCQLFTLLGPAGMGKSRLVADFLERVGADADVLRGRCLSYGEGITYWPLVEMLVPLGVEPEAVVASSPAETRVGFRRLLEARAADRPQVAVIDDLQWAEPEFVDLVEHVADLSRDAPIFLLCIARNELLDARPGWGGGKLNATSLLLEPLRDDDCETLIANLLGERDLATDARVRITEASGGNALFVEEMVAMVRESGNGEGLAVPPTINALLQARIDGLEPELRLVLERAAIEGEVFHVGAVADLSADEARLALDEHLAALVRKDLVRPERSVIAGLDAYRFRHLLIREAAYASMPKELRAQLHERYAEWLERTADESAFELDEIVGYHLEQALLLRQELGVRDDDLATRAAARLLAAGTRALGRADHPAAGGLLQRAVDIRSADDRLHLRAMFTLGRVFMRRGDFVRAESQLLETIELADAAEDIGILARARLGYNSLRIRVDPAETVQDELARALEITESLEGSEELAALATAYTEVGICKFQLGRAGEGEVDLERAAELARQLDDPQLLREVMGARLRPAGWGPMPAAEGVVLCEGLLAAEETNAALRAQALQILALFQAMLGEVEASRTAAATARTLLEEFDFTFQMGLYGGDIGVSELIGRDLDRAEFELRRAHDVLVEIGDVGVRSTVDAVLADALALQGRPGEALEFADSSRAIASVDDLDAQPRWRAARARALSALGRHDEALALLDEAVALAEPIDFLELKALVHDVHGEVLARVGRVEDAQRAVERAIGFHALKGNVVSAARSRSVLDDLRAGRPS